MLRFIFVCMGVVALSALSIMTQVMTDGISDAQMDIAARNDAQPEMVAAIAAPVEAEPTAAELNAIATAAGDEFDPGFGPAFTDEAPKALADPAPAAVMGAPSMETSAY